MNFTTTSIIDNIAAPVKGRLPGSPRGLEARRPRGGIIIDLDEGRRIIISAVRRPRYRRTPAGQVVEIPRHLAGRIAAYAAMAGGNAEDLWAYALSLGVATPAEVEG